MVRTPLGGSPRLLFSLIESLLRSLHHTLRMLPRDDDGSAIQRSTARIASSSLNNNHVHKGFTPRPTLYPGQEFDQKGHPEACANLEKLNPATLRQSLMDAELVIEWKK